MDERNLTEKMNDAEVFNAELWDNLTLRERELLCIRVGWNWDAINRIASTKFVELGWTAKHELVRVAFYEA